MSDQDKQEVIDELQRIAREKGADSVPRHEFIAKSKVTERRNVMLFGTYNQLVEAAGLIPHAVHFSGKPRYSDEDLIAEVVRVLRLPGAKPTARFFERNSPISNSTVMHRFGGWEKTLRAVTEHLEPSKTVPCSL